jgi:hypothetical protein
MCLAASGEYSESLRVLNDKLFISHPSWLCDVHRSTYPHILRSIEREDSHESQSLHEPDDPGWRLNVLKKFQL